MATYREQDTANVTLLISQMEMVPFFRMPHEPVIRSMVVYKTNPANIAPLAEHAIPFTESPHLKEGSATRIQSNEIV